MVLNATKRHGIPHGVGLEPRNEAIEIPRCSKKSEPLAFLPRVQQFIMTWPECASHGDLFRFQRATSRVLGKILLLIDICHDETWSYSFSGRPAE